MSYNDFRQNVLKKPPIFQYEGKGEPISCVYFIKFDYYCPNMGEMKLVKIGQSIDLKCRLKAHTKFPNGKLIGIIRSETPHLLETKIHQIFKNKRYGGCEYFLETDEIKEFIFDYMSDDDYMEVKYFNQCHHFHIIEKSEYRQMFEKWRDLWTYQKSAIQSK
jgi:hypothetical protein